MNRYSESSRRQLETCHEDLQKVFAVVLALFDHTVIEGHRSKERQRQLYAEGKTQKNGVTDLSRHNVFPSEAVDALPYPIDWGDRERMSFFAGYVIATAERMLHEGLIRHRIRWGGDWDRDTEVKDNRFDDLPHFELVAP